MAERPEVFIQYLLEDRVRAVTLQTHHRVDSIENDQAMARTVQHARARRGDEHGVPYA